MSKSLIPFFMWKRPIGPGRWLVDYRWWARPIAPLFRAWTSWRFDRCVKRLRKREAGTP